jgi:hypothetical protein
LENASREFLSRREKFSGVMKVPIILGKTPFVGVDSGRKILY